MNILWSFRRCPYAMRARMALFLSEINYEHREIKLNNKPVEFISLSSSQTVPVFVTEKGKIIEESLDIMEWSLNRNDPLNLLDCDYLETNLLIKKNDTYFKYHLDRYKYASRYETEASRNSINIMHRNKAEKFIEMCERKLSNGNNLLHMRQTIADLAIFPFIRQFSNVEPNWWKNSKYKKTIKWLDECLESDLFNKIMDKHSIWKP